MIAQIPQENLQSGDTAWVLVCAALVLFMTPGLAFFYAGMVSRRNALVMLQQNVIPLGVVSLTWVLAGYSLAFGDDTGRGYIADLQLLGLRNLGDAPAPALHAVTEGVAIPTLAFVAYQMMFAVITPALATGAVANRLKAFGWAVFLALWSVLVYPPIAHWLWAPAGWLTERGAQDWAGGMVVHASAGAAALALLLVLGRREVWPDRAPLPHSIPLVIIGAGILWFGWFGFNAGDGLQADVVAAQALVNTHVAAAAAMIVWILVERYKDGHATVLGSVTGAVAGLATITPAAGYVSTASAVAIGALAGLVCHLALRLKTRFRFDDALDVIAVHFVGGVLGTLLVGIFGEESVNAIGRDGIIFGGGFGLLGEQALALVVVVAFSFAMTWVIATAIERTIGLRVDPADEAHLDRTQQGMAAYHDGPEPATGVAALAGSTAATPATATAPAGGPLSLVTAVVHGTEPEGFDEALRAAGATRVLRVEAFVSSPLPELRVVRGEQRRIEAPARLRLEVLTPTASVDAVLAVLDAHGAALADALVLPVTRTGVS
ncbi:MAG TPA: ammonium transporter [Acidimicrobiales bacterium]|nr:ammonium transporter [Acidimicrobiales bacterium]